MRVIAGKYRGKLLKEFSLSSTKPTLDRVKESLFSSIQFDLIDANVLDLFSGTGGLGIECISRGAKYVDFVDTNTDAIKIIKQNLQGIDGQYSITKSDYLAFLNQVKQAGKRYDIILLDPPYNEYYGELSIQYIVDNELLNDGGIIMYEKAYNPPFNMQFDGYTIKEKKYGTVGVVKIVKNEQ